MKVFHWNMDTNLEYFFAESMKYHARNRASYPPQYESIKEWRRELMKQAKMWRWMHHHHYDNHDQKTNEKMLKYRVLTANFFMTHWGHLWD